jgi:integrase/recombinase XerD
VLGKGDKERLVPATNEMMVELARYRREYGLGVMASHAEDAPLCLPVGQSRQPSTSTALHTIVKGIVARAADRPRPCGDDYALRAAQLERASAHSLRHTAGSHAADQQVNRKRHLTAASTTVARVFQVASVTSSGGDYFDYGGHTGVEP